MFLVFIPLGQTIEHFPQRKQFERRGRTSFPRCRQRRSFLTLAGEKPAAAQDAEQDPQPIQVLAPGSRAQSRSKREVSILSRSIVELLFMPNPKSVIAEIFVDP